MRISDWSSDVCSSDLSGTDGACVRELALLHDIQHYRCDDARAVAEQSGQRQSGIAIFRTACTRRLASQLPDSLRSEEHTSELQSLMRISYAVFCLKKKNRNTEHYTPKHAHQ